jgi:hypothetical protein
LAERSGPSRLDGEALENTMQRLIMAAPQEDAMEMGMIQLGQAFARRCVSCEHGMVCVCATGLRPELLW